VSKLATCRFFGLVAVFLGAWVILPLAAGQAQHSHDFHPQQRLGLAADTAVRAGVHSKLPPHLSTLLGLSKEEETPMLQSVVRTGKVVQGFEVSDANKKDIVIFVVDESANNQDLYLTSPEGTLRRVVSVKAGVGNVVKMTENERNAFKKEKTFWVNRLGGPGASK
jgi:hypothetical protein